MTYGVESRTRIVIFYRNAFSIFLSVSYLLDKTFSSLLDYLYFCSVDISVYTQESAISAIEKCAEFVTSKSNMAVSCYQGEERFFPLTKYVYIMMNKNLLKFIKQIYIGEFKRPHGEFLMIAEL